MADKEKLATEGAFSAPPPGAPREVTSGSTAPTRDQIRTARANETDLPAFAPKPMTREAQIALIGREAVERLEQQGIVPTAPDPGPGPIPGGVPAEPAVAAEPLPNTSTVKPPDHSLPSKSRYRTAGQAKLAADAAEPNLNALPISETNEEPPDARNPRPPVTEQPSRYQPAASDTDTPSRGIPTPIEDEGKRITGGFGDIAEAQYIPLNGSELAEVVKGLLSEIDARLDDDLRFSMAVTYPRVRAKVIVEIQAHAQPGFDITKLGPPHTKTPLEIARARADEIVFVVIAQREEMTDAGESVMPPNALRRELELPIPGKRYVETPGGRQLVDLPSEVG